MKKITQHLAESGMSYTEHLLHSIKQSNQLIVIAIKSYIHGIFPGVFVNAGPLGVYKIYQEVKRLHHLQQLFKNHNKNE
jgi:hypothetical protein